MLMCAIVKTGMTYILMSNITRPTKSENNRLRELRRKLIVAKKTRVEDANRRNSIVVLHLVRFSTATAVPSRKDTRAVDVQAIGAADDPFDGFSHPINSGRATAAAGGSRGDGNESIRGDLGQEVLRGRAVVAAGAVTPDQHWHWGVWPRGRGIDGVPCQSVVRGERDRTVRSIDVECQQCDRHAGQDRLDLPIALALALDHSGGCGSGSSKESESELHCASTRRNE
jgi:hypothetical protein